MFSVHNLKNTVVLQIPIDLYKYLPLKMILIFDPEIMPALTEENAQSESSVKLLETAG